MSRRRNGMIVVAAVVAAVLGVGACVGGGTSGSSASSTPDPFGAIEIRAGEPIRIGALLAADGTTSPDVARAGIESLRGVEMAVDFLDGTFDGTPGRLLGHDIVVADVEDGCTPASGVEGAQAVAGEPGLVGVIGTTCSASASGATEVLSRSGVLMISPTNGDPTLTEPASHAPFYLRVAANSALEGRAAADAAIAALDAETAATIRLGDDAAGGPAEVFRTRFREDDRTVVSSEVVDRAGSIRSSLARLSEDPPDAIYLSLDGDATACATLAREAADTQGLSGTAILVSGGCLDAADAAVPGEAVLGGAYVVAPDLAPRSTDDFYRTQILPAYRERYESTAPSAAFAYGFDAASILLDAVARTAEEGSDGLSIPRSGLRDTAVGTDAYSGITGTLSCVPSGDCATDLAMAVYRVPAVPASSLDPVRPPADPVFTETVSVDDLAVP